MTATAILRGVKFSVCRAVKNNNDYKDKWRASSTKYRVELSRNNISFSSPFYMGSALKGKPTKLDVLNAFILDDVSSMTFKDFCDTFGYDYDNLIDIYDLEDKRQYEKVMAIWEGCKRETAFIHKAFTDDEIETIREYLEKQGF